MPYLSWVSSTAIGHLTGSATDDPARTTNYGQRLIESDSDVREEPRLHLAEEPSVQLPQRGGQTFRCSPSD